MTINNAITAMAGSFILISLALGVSGNPLTGNPISENPLYVNANFLWLTVFVGANLLQSSFTGFCPAAMVFKKMGLK